MFGTGQLAGDQFENLRESELVIQCHQICFDLACSHQVNAGQQYAIDVQQRLDPSRLLLLEQTPLRLKEALIVMSVMPRQAVPRDGLQFVVLGRRA